MKHESSFKDLVHSFKFLFTKLIVPHPESSHFLVKREEIVRYFWSKGKRTNTLLVKVSNLYFWILQIGKPRLLWRGLILPYQNYSEVSPIVTYSLNELTNLHNSRYSHSRDKCPFLYVCPYNCEGRRGFITSFLVRKFILLTRTTGNRDKDVELSHDVIPVDVKDEDDRHETEKYNRTKNEIDDSFIYL